MEQMYQDYKEIAEFRLIYIREAHAEDSSWPVPYAKEKGITEHKDYQQRCTTAKMLMDDKSLTMPMLIDHMNNQANESYRAYPDRVFLVRKDGRLAVAADRGPWGFNPGLKAVSQWLEKFEASGEEPELSAEQIAKADKATEARKNRLAKQLATQVMEIAGVWDVVATLGDQNLTGTIEFTVDDGVANGVATAGDQNADLKSLRFNGTQLSFSITMHDTPMSFVGELADGKIHGRLETPEQSFESHLTRKKAP